MINPKIYSASKIWHNTKWREMRDKRGYNIISTWIDFECGTKDGATGAKLFTPAEKAVLWQHCAAESGWADCMVVYAEEGDEMRGALVEMGGMLTQNEMTGIWKPVYVIGDCATFRVTGHSDVAFMHHKAVVRTPMADYRDGYQWARAHYNAWWYSRNPNAVSRALYAS